MVSRKDGKRIIHWPRIIIFAVAVWLMMSLGGAGVYYLLCQRWIYSEIPVFHIFIPTVTSLSFVIFILREELKAPLKELVEVKSKPSKPIRRPDRWRKIMKSNITKFAAATIIIAALTVVYQFTGSIDGASLAWAGVVEKCRNFKTLPIL